MNKLDTALKGLRFLSRWDASGTLCACPSSWCKTCAIALQSSSAGEHTALLVSSHEWHQGKVVELFCAMSCTPVIAITFRGSESPSCQAWAYSLAQCQSIQHRALLLPATTARKLCNPINMTMLLFVFVRAARVGAVVAVLLRPMSGAQSDMVELPPSCRQDKGAS